jgi:hypothetical protein
MFPMCIWQEFKQMQLEEEEKNMPLASLFLYIKFSTMTKRTSC